MTPNERRPPRKRVSSSHRFLDVGGTAPHHPPAHARKLSLSTVGVRSCILQANRRGDLGQRVAMSIVRRRYPGAAVGMPVSDRRKIQDLTPNAV